jgi:hypothetical protein
MPWRIVVQPNQKYARFSSVVDGFTHTNMTRDEAIAVSLQYPGMGKEDAEQKVEWAEAEPGGFAESLTDIEIRYGPEERQTIEAELKKKVP